MFKSIRNTLLAGLILSGLVMMSADHIDAPAVTGSTSDITDFYAFQGQDTDNLVFVANLQGLMSPGATAAAEFDENVLIEFNIDNSGDAIEDLVIQAIPRDGRMYFFGPVAPGSTGKTSSIMSDNPLIDVAISDYGQNASIGTSGAVSAFAGPRDDPFFMDFSQYGAIIGGSATGFNDPGADTFAGTNVMSIVIEVPKSTLGNATTISTWVESKTNR